MKNKQIYFIFLISAILILSIASIFASLPLNQHAKDNSKAPEHSPVIDSNWDLERIDFIHYAKPDNVGNPSKTSNSCYKLMGIKWNTLPVRYVINPVNSQGLDYSFIANAISTSAETWDSDTSKELFNDLYVIDASARYRVFDSKNSIVFGPYSDNNVIAVTSVWYTRAGKQIIEFDMLFNEYYIWGDAAIDPSVMDLQNIATHELGHSVGLDDIYTTTCSAVTMFGYSDEGDISKRTLEQPDITGLQKMYGI